MLDQEPNSPSTQGTSRRKIVQTALGMTPIVATLVSKPVQAVQGLSNMMSGDASVCRGDNRYGGMSPGFWKTPGGRTDAPYGDSHLDAWRMAGYSYGDLIAGKSGKKYEHYEGGSRYSNALGANINDPTRSLRLVLNEDSGSDQFHIIAGLLNASYFEARAGSASSTQYIFTVEQFWALYNGSMQVPDAYSSLADLISSNYHGVPGDQCGTWSSNDL